MPYYIIQNPAGKPIDLANRAGISGVSNIVVSGGVNGGITGASGASGFFAGAAGTALLANPTRRAWGISNFSTGNLMVSFGANPPTTGNINIVLQSGLAVYDGLGGRYIENPANYCGPVSVSGAIPNLDCLYSAWQL